MQKRRYTVDSIVKEYKIKNKIELQEFQKKNCRECKNKRTNKCDIRRDISGKLKCVYNEM